jgi:hypothetical protein
MQGGKRATKRNIQSHEKNDHALEIDVSGSVRQQLGQSAIRTAPRSPSQQPMAGLAWRWASTSSTSRQSWALRCPTWSRSIWSSPRRAPLVDAQSTQAKEKRKKFCGNSTILESWKAGGAREQGSKGAPWAMPPQQNNRSQKEVVALRTGYLEHAVHAAATDEWELGKQSDDVVDWVSTTPPSGPPRGSNPLMPLGARTGDGHPTAKNIACNLRWPLPTPPSVCWIPYSRQWICWADGRFLARSHVRSRSSTAPG